MTSDLRIEAQHSRWLFDAIHAHGDIERIIQGCHENLLSVRYLDPMLTKVRVRVCVRVMKLSLLPTNMLPDGRLSRMVRVRRRDSSAGATHATL